MFKSRMHSLALMMAVALSATVSVSAATAADYVKPSTAGAAPTAPTTPTSPTEPTEPVEWSEPGLEMTDSYVCEPLEPETTDEAVTPKKPKCR